MAIDLDDRSRCPMAKRCESCGHADDLDVATFGTRIGVYCLTVCGTCVAASRFPTGWAATAALVLRHCEHLGLDLDQMAAALETEAGS
jgi:hypothetical protein